MKERKSFATFKDGHTEEIFYFEKYSSDKILFATESGVYMYHKGIVPIGVAGLVPEITFSRLTISPSKLYTWINWGTGIESITLDERVEVSYSLDIKGRGSIMGKVLVAPNAEFNEIRNAILDDLRDASAEKIDCDDCDDSYIPNKKPVFEKDELVEKEEKRRLLDG